MNNVTTTIMSNNTDQDTTRPVKIAKTSAFGGISKGDELHFVDGDWHLNGDPDDWFIDDEIVQRHPRLFIDKTSGDEKTGQIESKTDDKSHSPDNPARY